MNMLIVPLVIFIVYPFLERANVLITNIRVSITFIATPLVNKPLNAIGCGIFTVETFSVFHIGNYINK